MAFVHLATLLIFILIRLSPPTVISESMSDGGYTDDALLFFKPHKTFIVNSYFALLGDACMISLTFRAHGVILSSS